MDQLSLTARIRRFVARLSLRRRFLGTIIEGILCREIKKLSTP